MAAANGIKEHYLATLNISTLEHLKIYNKESFGIPESDRYDPTISKWTGFYQELEDSVSTFGFKVAFSIVTARYGHHAPT